MYACNDLFEQYAFVKSSIRNDLEDIARTAGRIVDFGSDDLLSKCILSAERNSRMIGDVAGTVYYRLKDALYYLRYGDYCGKKESSIEISVPAFAGHFTEKKTEKRNCYSAAILSVADGTNSSIIKEAAEALSGKMHNSYDIKSRKPKRLWRWDERINYFKSLTCGVCMSAEEKAEMIRLKEALSQNTYLKRRKREQYDALVKCFSALY